MTAIFLKFVNMSIAASWLVLAVLIFRLIFRRAPKWLNPLLWGIVGLRLILPFSIESAFSLIPSPEPISPEIMYAQEPAIHSDIPAVNTLVNPIISQTFAPTSEVSVNPLQILIPVAAGIWMIGVALMFLYTGISYLRLRKDIRTAVWLRDNIYQSENLASPFVLGFFHPHIYLPFRMTEKDRTHVIAHEQTHMKRHDHWIKPLGFLLLSLHWFNPLLWIAYILFCRDIELACDERVIRELGAEQRADYSQALLNCSVPHRTITPCPLAFGEVGVKERVKNVLSYRKPAFWIVIVAFLSCIVIAVCFLTNPERDKLNDIIGEKGYIITEQKPYDFTLSIPKEKLTDSIYTPEGQTFKKNEVIVYQTDTTNVYLEYVMPSNSEDGTLWFAFDFSYRLPKSGKIVIPHYKDDIRPFEDIMPDINYRGEARIGLRNKTLSTPTEQYPDTVDYWFTGPEEKFGFCVSMDAYRSAEEVLMIDVSSYEWTYCSDEEAETATVGGTDEPQQREIRMAVNKVNHEAFTGEIKEVQDIIMKQQREYESYMNWYPLHYQKSFDTIEECMSYVGIDIPYLTIEQDVPVKLNVYGNHSGKIVALLIDMYYETNGNGVQFWYHIFTDLDEDSPEMIIDGIEGGNLLEDGVLTSEGDSIVIFKTADSEENGYRITAGKLKNNRSVPMIIFGKNENNVELAECCFSQGDIVYSIHVSSDEGNDISAEETLREILETVE